MPSQPRMEAMIAQSSFSCLNKVFCDLLTISSCFLCTLNFLKEKLILNQNILSLKAMQFSSLEIMQLTMLHFSKLTSYYSFSNGAQTWDTSSLPIQHTTIRTISLVKCAIFNFLVHSSCSSLVRVTDFFLDSQYYSTSFLAFFLLPSLLRFCPFSLDIFYHLNRKEVTSGDVARHYGILTG